MHSSLLSKYNEEEKVFDTKITRETIDIQNSINNIKYEYILYFHSLFFSLSYKLTLGTYVFFLVWIFVHALQGERVSKRIRNVNMLEQVNIRTGTNIKRNLTSCWTRYVCSSLFSRKCFVVNYHVLDGILCTYMCALSCNPLFCWFHLPIWICGVGT